MKKKLLIIISTTIFLTGFSPSWVTPNGPKLTVTALVMSHIAIMGISAHYYCDNGSWPDSIDVIEKYASRRLILPDIPIKWRQLKRYSRYTSKPNYVVDSIAELSATETLTVASGQDAPDCNGQKPVLRGTFIDT